MGVLRAFAWIESAVEDVKKKPRAVLVYTDPDGGPSVAWGPGAREAAYRLLGGPILAGLRLILGDDLRLQLEVDDDD